MLEPLTITFYTRPGCHLCEDVADHLADLQHEWTFNISVVDITGNPTIFAQFWSQIPVLDIAGTQVRAPINPVHLASTIARAARGHTRKAS